MTRKQRKYGSGASMGMSKHRQSGQNQYSPKLRHQMKLEAEKKDKKTKASEELYSSISEAIKANKN